MIYTTLNKIRGHAACTNGWQKLLRHLGKTQADDEPLALATILDSNGLDDALWCLRAVDDYDREKRLFAVACVRRVQHLIKDPRSLAALDVAERYANGQITDEKRDAARDAARAAVGDAAALDAARAVARDAAWAATLADEDVAARAAARAAVEAAAGAAWAASWATWYAARAAEIGWQTAEFQRVFCTEEVTA